MAPANPCRYSSSHIALVRLLSCDALLAAHVDSELAASPLWPRFGPQVAQHAIPQLRGDQPRRSRVTSPLSVIAVTSLTRERIFGSVSTAAMATAGSSDRLSETSLRSSWLGPKLAILAALRCCDIAFAEQIQHRVGQKAARVAGCPLALAK